MDELALLQYYFGTKQFTKKRKNKKAQIGVSCPKHKHEIHAMSQYVHGTKCLLDTKHRQTPDQRVVNKVLRHYMTHYDPYTKDPESYIFQLYWTVQKINKTDKCRGAWRKALSDF